MRGRLSHNRLTRAGGIVLLMVLMCSSCAVAPLTKHNLDRFPLQLSDQVDVPIIPSMTAITPEMEAFVQRHVRQERSARRRLDTLLDLVHNKAYLGVRYVPTADYGAASAFRLRETNCLSYSALIVTLAREAGMDARFQLAPMLPSWRKHGDTYLVEQHVNVSVRILNKDYLIDFEPPRNLSSTRPKPLNDHQTQAMLLGNLGATALGNGDYITAYALFRQGLELDPDALGLWINLGVALVRHGEFEAGERAYRVALSLDPGNLSALNNLMILGEQRGEDVSALALQLARYRDKNPYYLYWSALAHADEGRLDQATELLNKAIVMRSDEMDFYVLLADIEQQRGNQLLARRQLETALDNAYSIGQRARILKLLDG